jgi:hypothetical protein
MKVMYSFAICPAMVEEKLAFVVVEMNWTKIAIWTDAKFGVWK